MKVFFPSVEGLRLVAALLVVVYHIWTDRISGGVDVFFVISGLLVTLSLIRQVERHGNIRAVSFFSGLALRLLPAALTVLMAVLVGAFYLLPATDRLETFREIVASTLYLENWLLADRAIDYLDRESPPSVVQHFWAMSVQGQFYLYAVALFWAATRGKNLIHALLVINGSVFAISLGYSVYQTYFGDQAWAYFDTFARLWEFAIGSMLGVAIWKRPDLSLPGAFGWIGLAGILLCGAVFKVGTVFPGAAGLFPAAAAILVVLGSRSDSRWSVGALLGSGLMVSLGAIAYALYLVHWPLLIFYQQVAGARPGFLAGFALIAASIGLAGLIHVFVERPVLAVRKDGSSATKLRVAAIGFAPALAVAVGVYVVQHISTTVDLKNLTAALPPATPLTLVSEERALAEPDSYVPAPEIARLDRPVSYEDRCHTLQGTLVPAWCSYGVTDGYVRTLAMVGGSHVAHWLPALQTIAERHKWRILYSTWSACRFNIDGGNDRCRALSDAALRDLKRLQPDLVFMTATVGTSQPDRIGTLKALERLGFPVLAVRGTPRHDVDVPTCLASSDDYLSCGSPRSEVLRGALDMREVPANTTILDISDYFCSRTFCPPTANGVVIYSDMHHITTTFMRTLTAALESSVLDAMDRAPEREAKPTAEPTLWHVELACGRIEGSGAFSRSLELRMVYGDGNGSLTYVQGNPIGGVGAFELWEGTVEDDVVSVLGRYQVSADTEVKTIRFSGTIINGTLKAVGRRGARECTLMTVAGEG